MIEKVTNESISPKKEEFEFILTINGNIICQRYFRINGFRKEAYGSIDLIQAIDNCVNMIDNDLKAKTHIYYENTAPQVFKDEQEMNWWADAHRGESIDHPVFVIFEDSESCYIWDGNEMIPYNKQINRADYVSDKEHNNEYVLKFAFCDNGREVCSKVWDGSVYPRFIRTNIDLSNSKNKYRADGVFAPVEKAVIDLFNESQEDLIPILVREICQVCSYNDIDDYETSADYGYDKDGNEVEYNLNIREQNYRFFKGLDDYLYRKYNGKKTKKGK